MSLKGSTEEFPLLDIFRLISSNKKTGQLTLTAEEKEGKISFISGLVCFAITPQNRIPLGLRLVNAGLLTKEELEEALLAQQSKESQKKLGEILVARALIKQTNLEEFVQEQIQDALFEILDWENGFYCFDTATDLGQENIGINFTVDKVIEEVEKRKEEWKEIKETIPSTQMVAKLSDLPGKQPEDIILKPEEWRIIYFLDKERSVADLKEKSQLTLLKLCQIIKNMLSKNLIALMPASQAQQDAPEKIQAEEPAKIPGKLLLEELEDAINQSPGLDNNDDHESGKYVKDYRKEKTEKAKKITVPLEWARYLTAPKKIAG